MMFKIFSNINLFQLILFDNCKETSSLCTRLFSQYYASLFPAAAHCKLTWFISRHCLRLFSVCHTLFSHHRIMLSLHICFAFFIYIFSKNHTHNLTTLEPDVLMRTNGFKDLRQIVSKNEEWKRIDYICETGYFHIFYPFFIYDNAQHMVLECFKTI